MSTFAIAAAASQSYALTPGNLGGSPGVFGYSTVDSNPGSLSPVGTLKGTAFQRIRSSSASEDLLVTMAATGLSQAYWRMVVVQGTDNTWRRYLSSAATFADSGSICSWSFGTGSSPVWTSTAGPRGVLFFL